MIKHNEANKIEKIVKKAGEMILSAHLEKNDIHKKEGPANFVTDYDVRIQEYLISSLSDIIPGCCFFGEEETDGNSRTINDGYVFFLDPIDGTTNFMFDYRNSCVSVGLAVNGSMIAGWVFDPYTDQMWRAQKGKGAFLNERRLKIFDKSLDAGICAFGCARYNEGDMIFTVLEELFMRSLSIRNGGSAAIDLCRIASGSNVGYVEMKLQPYDYAAASVIVTEAGGVIGTADDMPVSLDMPCSIVAGTPSAAEEIRRLLNGTESVYL